MSLEEQEIEEQRKLIESEEALKQFKLKLTEVQPQILSLVDDVQKEEILPEINTDNQARLDLIENILRELTETANRLTLSINSINKGLQANLEEQRLMRERERTTLNQIDDYLKKWV
jgi:hypothetical protein